MNATHSESELSLDLRSYNAQADSHYHDFHQLVLPIRGRLEMEVDNTAGHVEQAQAAVVHAGQVHSFSALSDNRFVVADIPTALAPDLETLPAYIPLSNQLSRYALFLNSTLSIDNSKPCQRQMILLLLQLLSEQAGNNNHYDRRFLVVQGHIDRNLNKNLRLKELAQIANISQRQLGNLFHRHLNMSMRQYILQQRMRLACRLLSETQYSVQLIGEHCGYSNLSAFSARFSQCTSVPPGQYREHHKNH